MNVSDEFDQGSAPAEETVEQQEYSQPSNEPAPSGNPFWGEVESKLGPNSYALIQPYLAKADAEHQRGIEAANARFAPYKPFAEQNISPEMLQQAVGLVQQLDSAPEKIYEQLGAFLQQTGRLPNPQEAQQIADDIEEEEDPRDAQIRMLQGNQEQIQQYLAFQAQQAQQARAEYEAETWMDGELKQLEQQFAPEDVKEILRIAASNTNGGQIEPDIKAAVQHFTGLRDRIRNAPRASDSAPRIPGGVGGGTPGQANPNPAKMSDAERQAYVAQMFSK